MRSRISFAALLACLSFTSALQGNSLAPACIVDNLAAYGRFNSDAQCSVGILNFLDFSFSASGTGGATLLTASQIKVTPDTTGSLGGGFSFSAEDPVNAPFAVGANQTATYFIDWFFVIDSGPVASGADLGMDPPFGNVSITQAYCPDGTLNGRNSCSPGFESLTVSAPPCTDPVNHPEFCRAHLDFDPLIHNFAEVVTTIVLTGGTVTGAGFDSLTGTSTVVDPGSPEPVTWMLGLGGLLAIGLFRKHRNV